MDRVTLKVDGLHCSHEAEALKKVMTHEGIYDLAFDLIAKKVTVTFDPKKLHRDELLKLAKQSRLKVRFDRTAKEKKKKLPFIFCALCGLTLIAAFIFGSIPLYIISFLLGLWFVFPKALASILDVRFDMNVLMMIAVAGAIWLGMWLEAGTVTFLFAVSLLLESWSVEKARKAIGALLDLSPKTAKVISDGEQIEKMVDEVLLKERIFVSPGDRIPLDGIVLEGTTSVDQSPITGESVPVEKEIGDELFAGTINGDGALTFEVTRESKDTTLAHIIDSVETARAKRAPAEQWVDQFAKVYTPIMLCSAIAVALIPPFLFGALWAEWIYRALVLLVIACPCALVISTPVTIISALSSAARNGVLIKGGLFLEEIARITGIAFDKTGTISEGKPTVQRVVPLNDHTEEELIEIATRLEGPSTHPLARAIRECADEKGIFAPAAEDYQVFKGLGAEGTLDGKRYWLGSHRFMHEAKRKEDPKAHDVALELEDAGHSVVAIGDFTHICGLFSIFDAPRKTARGTIQKLRSLGIELIALLTGDNEKTAQALSQTVGIDIVASELLPDEKVETLTRLKEKNERIAMVGDGVNDAPALAASSVGIAMGGMGTDVAFETADIVLMEDDLEKLPWLISHGRRAMKVVRQNIVFALSVKALFITLDGFGLATLWMAIAADTGASLLVIFNGMRLLRRNP